MAYIDISSFFNTSSTNVMSNFNYSDYSSIRNGSYGKLLKSYYKKMDDDSVSSKEDSTKKKKTDATDTTGLSKMKSDAESLKKAAEAFDKDDVFKTTNGAYDKDKILSAVKSFATEYNDVVTQAGKVSGSDVVKQTDFLKSLTKTMSKALDKVGVSVGTDGKLTVDEDAFKNADMKEVKSLFSGNYSYASQVSQKASGISSAAVRNSSTYSSTGTLSNNLSGLFDQMI